MIQLAVCYIIKTWTASSFDCWRKIIILWKVYFNLPQVLPADLQFLKRQIFQSSPTKLLTSFSIIYVSDSFVVWLILSNYLFESICFKKLWYTIVLICNNNMLSCNNKCFWCSRNLTNYRHKETCLLFISFKKSPPTYYDLLLYYTLKKNVSLDT